MAFIYAPINDSLQIQTEVNESIARLIQEAIKWHIDNVTNSFLSKSSVEFEGSTKVFTQENSGGDLDNYFFLIPDYNSELNEGFLDRPIDDYSDTFWQVMDINLTLENKPESAKKINEITHFLINSFCRNTNSNSITQSWTVTLASPFSGQAYSSSLLLNKLLAHSTVFDNALVHKRIKILFNVNKV